MTCARADLMKYRQDKVSTPWVNWKHGEDVIIAGSVNDDDAKKMFLLARQFHIRIVKQPG